MRNRMEILATISKIHRRQVSIFNSKLKEYDISHGDRSYLFIIDDNPGLSQNELTKYLSNNKATTAKIIKRLVAEEYVIRRVDSHDKRGYKLFLGDRGKKKVEELREEVSKYSEGIFDDFDEAEAELLYEKLSKLLRTMDEIYKKEV